MGNLLNIKDYGNFFGVLKAEVNNFGMPVAVGFDVSRIALSPSAVEAQNMLLNSISFMHH